MSASEGRRVDQYLAVQPKPAEIGVLQLLKIRFDYLECVSCGRILETSKLTQAIVESWKFELMHLRPSILGVARATCPVCQELQQQFAKVFRS
jgi:Zn ribbon nucleic-acid-binding protein